MTLRDDSTGDVRGLDLLLFVGAPFAAGVVLALVGFRMKDIAAVLAALAVFTALLFGLVIFVFQLRVQIKGRKREESSIERDRPRIAILIDETFANVTYSVIVGLVITVVGVVAAAVADKNDGAPVWVSALLGALGLHLVLTILMCLKRVNSAYQQLKL